ncbi:MAG TPA: MBL fold metallo-hydrolase [Gaiellales bacterium]|jgi:hypothetical protein|nr:MBL fold metallo-hydrolase [Gaiellales bacterium]
MAPLRQLAPGLWQFSRPRQGIPPTATAYALHDDRGTILVDPLADARDPELLQALDELARGNVRILVTIPFHVRGSELLWRRWRDRHEVTIFGHAQCLSRLDDDSGFRPLKGGELLDGDIRVHTFGHPQRSEMPFELPSHRALAVGDTLLEIDGKLRVWAEVDSERRRAWYEQRFLPTLRPLSELDLERVLVTHGEPVLRDGARVLAECLAGTPWRRTPAG